jgi:hypothetical protein
MFLLRLEGRTSGLSRLLQVKDHRILFLAGLAMILAGDAQLVQLSVKPHDLFVPQLEGCLRLLERGTLLPKLTLRLLPRHMLTLEGSPSLSKGGPL